MFLFFLFFCFLRANEDIINIQSSYCVSGNNILLSDISKNKNHKNIFIKMPSNSNFQIQSTKLIKFLEKYNLKFIDNSNGIIKFIRHCNIEQSMPFLKVALKNNYEKTYKNIKINSIIINLKSQIPSDFDQLKFDKLIISKTSLRNSKGVFRAIFLTNQGFKKTLNFDYQIDGEIAVYKAKKNISQGKILTKNDYKKMIIKLDNLPNNLLNIIPKKPIVSQRIAKESILCNHHFKTQTQVLKNTFADLVFEEKNMIISVQVMALNDGNEGDLIKIKTKEGKILRAIVISDNKVKIQE